MIAALGFVPGNAGFGVAIVESDDMDAAKTALSDCHGRDDFVRVIILKSETPIEIAGNWSAPFDLKNATLDQVATLMGS
jgi:hypothetical protein